MSITTMRVRSSTESTTALTITPGLMSLTEERSASANWSSEKPAMLSATLRSMLGSLELVLLDAARSESHRKGLLERVMKRGQGCGAATAATPMRLLRQEPR